jgi:ABC-type Fe3+/spermidine/putrescine transport system ATPase subunit
LKKVLSLSDEKTTLAVQIENAYKSYGNYSILKNLNLNLLTGTIYSLLGPSGCG